MTRRIVLLSLLSTALAFGGSIKVHGHRGARSILPENTIPGFEYAIAAGADFIELDLAVTRDNILVVSHDPEINTSICQGPAGERAIRKMTLDEVLRWDCGAKKNSGFPEQKPVPGTRIPTFDQVLALASNGDFAFNIEIKSDPRRPEMQPDPDEFARLVVNAVRKHKLEKRVIVQSFDFRTLHAVKRQAPDLTLAALYGVGLKDFIEIAKEAGTPIVAPNYNLVTEKKVQQAHEAGLQVVPWTVNNAAGWDRMIAAKVDAIITDDPATLIKHLKEKGLR